MLTLKSMKLYTNTLKAKRIKRNAPYKNNIPQTIKLRATSNQQILFLSILLSPNSCLTCICTTLCLCSSLPRCLVFTYSSALSCSLSASLPLFSFTAGCSCVPVTLNGIPIIPNGGKPILPFRFKRPSRLT